LKNVLTLLLLALALGCLGLGASVATVGDSAPQVRGAFRSYVPLAARSSPPTPTPTVAVPTPTATVPAGVVGSRENPVPIGTEVTLGGGWIVNVVSVTPNATQLVLDENQFNDPPKPGHQFFIAEIEARYTGADSGSFDGSFRLRVLGATSVVYTTFGNSCGVIPDNLPDPEVFNGGIISGNLCWEVPASDADDLVMLDRPFLDDAGNVFLSLVPGGPVQPIPVPQPSLPPPLAPGAGTRENPLPIGTPARLAGTWIVTVVSVTPDATEEVLAENQFNSPPEAGSQFFMARIRATYAGDGSARFDGGFRLRTLGATAVVWTTFGNSCGVIPDSLPDPEVFYGGTIEGNLCWEIPGADAGSLRMLDDPFLEDSLGTFLSLVP
jgi:hypothetical protein